MTYTIEQIDEAFDKMPKELAEAIASIKLNQKIQEIGQKFNLHIDSLGELSGLVNFVLIGLEPNENFSTKVSQITKLPPEQNTKLVEEINEGIFKAVREKYKLYSETEEGEAEVQPEPIKIVVTPPTPAITASLVNDKMTAPFRLPKQETDVSIIKTTPDIKDLPTPGIMPPNPSSVASGSPAPSPAKLDPYREKPL